LASARGHWPSGCHHRIDAASGGPRRQADGAVFAAAGRTAGGWTCATAAELAPAGSRLRDQGAAGNADRRYPAHLSLLRAGSRARDPLRRPRPPTEMIERRPYLPRFMAGGPGNPLGARAMYLGSTVYRIHGTNQPSTIGKFVSSGCIGMLNEDVSDLFDRVKVGTRVVVFPGG